MPRLELNSEKFQKMLNTNSEFMTNTYFPEGVHIKQPEDCSVKEDIFDLYPEVLSECNYRGISIVERINQRIRSESKNDQKTICHLLVAHGEWVDKLGTIYHFLERKARSGDREI